jgi:HAMP domain-containing protein
LTVRLERADRGRIERGLAGLYERLGSRILYVCLGSAAAITLVAVAIVAAGAQRYMRMSISQLVSFTALWASIMLALALLALPISWGQIRTILAWSSSDRSPEQAIDTWYAIVRLPLVARRAALLATALVPFAGVDLVARLDKPWYGAIGFIIACDSAAVGIFALFTFLNELILRPMIEDVAAHLPDGFKPRMHGMRLRTRALFPLPAVTFFAAIIVGAYADLASNPTVRLMLVLGVTVVCFLIATAVFVIITRSLLAPIDDLIAATERVGAGDITTPVPLVSADELGSLAYSFNEMLTDLRSHGDELRASRERIVAAADTERRRIERDLHDGAQQRTSSRRSASSATWPTASTPRGSRTTGWQPRSTRRSPVPRSVPSSNAGGPGATAPSSRRRCTSPASRRFRTRSSTPARTAPRPCGSASRTERCGSRSPTTGPASTRHARRAAAAFRT